MNITDLRDVIEGETGVIFAEPTDSGMPVVQEGLMEYAGASEADKLLGRLFQAYVEHKGGELTQMSLVAILSELQYLSDACQRIAVKLEPKEITL